LKRIYKNMTVRWCSRDAEGDARGLPRVRRQDVAGRTGPSSMPEATSLKQLGSRFCVLAAESSDSDDEIWEEKGGLRGSTTAEP
jgi:hypothetical protein